MTSHTELPIKFTPAAATTIKAGQLLKVLQNLPEDYPIYVYNTNTYDRHSIECIDSTIEGYVDLNICAAPQNQGTWRIRCIDSDEVLYWSNKDGWVTSDYTIFIEDERNKYNLPINGEWERVCEYPRTVMEFCVLSSEYSIFVIIHKILTDEEKEALDEYWYNLWTSVITNEEFPDTDEELVVKALEHFNYSYEILQPDHTAMY